MNICISKFSFLCSSCLRMVQGNSATRTILPKRYRYYWDARPENRQRKMLMMITVPRLKARKDHPIRKQKQTDKLYGLDVLLHKEVQDIFNKSRMIAVCLFADQLNDDYYHVRYQLQQHNMNMECYDQHVMEFTLKDTPYSNFLRLFDGPTTIIYGEPNVSDMISAVKKNKHLLLIGGMVDGKYMTLQQLSKFADLKGLDHSRSELSGLLASAVSSTYDLLQRPSASLATSLQQHCNETGDGGFGAK